jgi:hypothetical protein
MRVEFAGEDYVVNLTSRDLKELLTPVPHGIVPSLHVFPELESQVLGTPTEERLCIGATQDAFEIFSAEAHDRILFEREEEGPTVTVFAGLLYRLLIDEIDTVGTRYDGYSDKIIIRKEDRVRPAA